ncbi:hypothetical protein KIN20_034006 [Parelaphostrongylus tenuis]|uniref:Uncharacterized protein n=1 Tax=Parelaphostrongylus tenuis TaxID=148309 RepID=A0AAD5R9P1_PARTN|nr:hypothetical protein KIN20_034006 [Parelaphostrongylus tenuis]
MAASEGREPAVVCWINGMRVLSSSYRNYMNLFLAKSLLRVKILLSKKGKV